MNKVKFLICAVVASMALVACTIDDNPVIVPDDSTTVNVDNPQEEVTDQPAASRTR